MVEILWCIFVVQGLRTDLGVVGGGDTLLQCVLVVHLF